MKVSWKKLSLYLLLIFCLIFIFNSLVLLSGGAISPQNNIQLSNGICLDMTQNSGSGEWTNINSYNCDDPNKLELDTIPSKDYSKIRIDDKNNQIILYDPLLSWNFGRKEIVSVTSNGSFVVNK